MTEKKLELGQVQVSDYVPSAEDLARLAKNKVEEPPPPPPVPEVPVAERLAIIAPSTASKTMAEMERGKQIVEQRQKERARRREMAGLPPEAA
jgi:hypothetical protein